MVHNEGILSVYMYLHTYIVMMYIVFTVQHNYHCTLCDSSSHKIQRSLQEGDPTVGSEAVQFH